MLHATGFNKIHIDIVESVLRFGNLDLVKPRLHFSAKPIDVPYKFNMIMVVIAITIE